MRAECCRLAHAREQHDDREVLGRNIVKQCAHAFSGSCRKAPVSAVLALAHAREHQRLLSLKDFGANASPHHAHRFRYFSFTHPTPRRFCSAVAHRCEHVGRASG